MVEDTDNTGDAGTVEETERGIGDNSGAALPDGRSLVLVDAAPDAAEAA